MGATMLKDLDLVLETHSEGNFPVHAVVRWVVQEIAERGFAQDMLELPEWLQTAVIERLEQFKADGVWTAFFGEGGEQDIAPFALKALSKLTEQFEFKSQI